MNKKHQAPLPKTPTHRHPTPRPRYQKGHRYPTCTSSSQHDVVETDSQLKRDNYLATFQQISTWEKALTHPPHHRGPFAKTVEDPDRVLGQVVEQEPEVSGVQVQTLA